MKPILFLVLSLSLFTSCDYAKQEMGMGELRGEIRKLNARVQKYKIDSLLKSQHEIDNIYRLKATKIIDSLRLNDPNTFNELVKEVHSNLFEY